MLVQLGHWPSVSTAREALTAIDGYVFPDGQAKLEVLGGGLGAALTVEGHDPETVAVSILIELMRMRAEAGIA